MRIVLVMSRAYHTPINVWLDMTLGMLFDWVVTADTMDQEAKSKGNMQSVGPGL
jgi:hypothetical protein